MATVAMPISMLRARKRPQGYLEDCRRAAISATETHLTFDKESSAWRWLVDKYTADARKEGVERLEDMKRRGITPAPCCGAKKDGPAFGVIE